MSQDYKITVEIYCNWQGDLKNYVWPGDPWTYRLYIDNELLAERTYIWVNPEQFIEERIVINVPAGQHKFQIIPTEPRCKGFYYTNFKVNGMPTEIKHSEFTI